MLVDTGCAITVITPQAANRLSLDQSRFTGRRVMVTAGGASMSIPTARIPGLQLGTAVLRDVEVGVLELPAGLAVDGLLGVNVLESVPGDLRLPPRGARPPGRALALGRPSVGHAL